MAFGAVWQKWDWAVWPAQSLSIFRGRVKNVRGLKILITVAELAGWGVIIKHCWFGYNTKDFQIPVMVFFLLILTFLYESYLDLLLDNRVSAFLGKISFYMYINQLIVIRPVQFYKLPFSPLLTAVLTISAIFVVSLFSAWFVKILGKKIKTRCAIMS